MAAASAHCLRQVFAGALKTQAALIPQHCPKLCALTQMTYWIYG